MKKMLKLKMLATCLVMLVLMFPTSVLAQGVVSHEVEEHIISQLQRANIPNAAVAVIYGGETSYILKDSNHDMLFGIGSVAKPFTAFGVLVLEEMGLLSVSDPINMHLPWFEARYNGVPVPHGDIRIYNFLQHTSGFINDDRRFPNFSVETASEFISLYTGIF